MRRKEERERAMRNEADGLVVLSQARATTSSSHRIEEDMVVEDWTPTVPQHEVCFFFTRHLDRM